MKKRVLVVLSLVLALGLPLAAFADNTGYDGGFYIKNDDDTFKVKFNGRFQTKLFFEKQSGYPSQLSFQIRRAQLGVKAYIHEFLTTGFTLKHAVGDVAGTNFQTVNVSGAFASVEVIPEFIVTIGMVGLPLDIMSETSSAWYLLPESPITNTQSDGLTAITPLRPSFGVPDGLGVNFSGGYWKWFYSLSAVNGAESNYDLNPDMKMSVGFRTGFNILDPVPGKQTDFECSSTPKLTVSMGTMYQGKRIDPNTNADIKYLWTASAGGAFRWGGFSFNTEGYYRKTRITSIGNAIWARPRLTDIGYYASAGYYILPMKLEVAGQAGQIIRQGPDNDSWQFGGGFNYYILENNLKVQAAYTITTDFDDVTGTRSNKINNFSLMASAFF